ncbi:hypothetical protein JQX14_04215 [Sulfitobacter pseudonitzschiae]|uniref:Uncharacterized protein n=1 Tax=Pseudosulfitobacter pseudonitzschiae TaxID=1402135 RepID=A0A9Q2RR80_9RHOB|nr:hypothetical protein [Pseudosulfitobacter pseudonitzschiae]
MGVTRGCGRPIVRTKGSENTTWPASGLGLSLVAAACNLHGADLALGDARPGLSVTIRFPS